MRKSKPKLPLDEAEARVRLDAARLTEQNLRITLRHARVAGAKKTIGRIRQAISSAGGAIRHAEGKLTRTRYPETKGAGDV